MQTDLRRIHGASPHGEGDDAQPDPNRSAIAATRRTTVRPLGVPGNPQVMRSAFRPAVRGSRAGRSSPDRRGVQQPVGGGAEHDLPGQSAVGRGAEHQQFGVDFGDHLDQTAGDGLVGVAVIGDLDGLRLASKNRCASRAESSASCWAQAAYSASTRPATGWSTAAGRWWPRSARYEVCGRLRWPGAGRVAALASDIRRRRSRGIPVVECSVVERAVVPTPGEVEHQYHRHP